MSDVILYAAIKENIQLQQELLEFCTGGAGIGISFYEDGANQDGYPYGGEATVSNFSACPPLVNDWVTNLCPVLNTDLTCGFKVCDTSSYYRCGNNCTWCVPPGVCCAQFQLWGPGSGTSGQNCCGGSPFGPSGAYMVIQMPVTPGECYCLCSGCAYCCYASQTTPGICGSPSYIRNGGNGFCACADSGISCYCHWNEDIGTSVVCGRLLPSFDSCSPRSCSGYNFCWDNSNGVEICHAFASRTTFHLVNSPSDGRTVEYYGLNGLWPAIKLNNNFHISDGGYSTPVFGFESCVCKACYCGIDGNESRYGCYYGADEGFLQIPGAGGYHTYSCGGAGDCRGDSGRMGMICVSYTCN